MAKLVGTLNEFGDLSLDSQLNLSSYQVVVLYIDQDIVCGFAKSILYSYYLEFLMRIEAQLSKLIVSLRIYFYREDILQRIKSLIVNVTRSGGEVH